MTLVATVTRRETGGAPHLAMLTLGRTTVPCAIGEAGLTDSKREGDGATPIGLLPLRRVLFRADRVRPPPPGTVPRAPIGASDGWCDDPLDSAYNRAVRLPYGARAERLHREDDRYDVVGILGWNDAPVVRDRGSAIFLHVATADLGPTAGCIALPLPDLLHLLAAGLTAIRTTGS